MNVIGKAKKDTYAYSGVPGDSSYISGVIPKDQTFRIQGIKRIGLDAYYQLSDGSTVHMEDVQVLQDIDYYQGNHKSKVLVKRKLNEKEKLGLSTILGDYGKDGFTKEFEFDLQRFSTASILKGISTIKSTAKVAAGIGAAATGGIYSGVGGGFAGGMSQGGREYQAMQNNKLTSIFATKSDSTVGKLLNGITVGDVGEGNLFDLMLENALGLLGGWIMDKLSFVVGFDIEAVLSALFDLFGMNWQAIFNGEYSAFINSGNIPDFWHEVYGPGKYDYWNGGGKSVTSGYGIHWYQVYAGQGDLWAFNYAPVTQHMKDYFKYKGINGHTITRRFGDLVWEDYNYSTEILEPHRDEEEIKVWKTLYDRDLNEFSDSMHAIREELNIDIDRKTIVEQFNRFRVPTPDNELAATRGYVFFTRPDLNLNLQLRTATQGNIQGVARFSPLVENLKKSHAILTKYLMGDDAEVPHKFIPIFTHAVTQLDVSDEVLETTESGDTFTGWKYSYGTSLIKSKTAGTVNVGFTDDDMLSVYKLIKLWCEYINAVYRGECMPKQQYIDNHELDYATSIYYFLCKATSENEIIFWTKYTGCFPTSIPSSGFSDQLGTTIKHPSYSVPFAFSRKDDYSPLNIVEFNNLSDGDFEYMPIYNPDTHMVNKSFVGAPFVDTNDGSRLFKLKFRAPGN